VKFEGKRMPGMALLISNLADYFCRNEKLRQGVPIMAI